MSKKKPTGNPDQRTFYSMKTENNEKDIDQDELLNLIGTYRLKKNSVPDQDIDHIIEKIECSAQNDSLKGNKSKIIPNMLQKGFVGKTIDWRGGSFVGDKFYYSSFAFSSLCLIHGLSGIIYHEIDSQLLAYEIFCSTKEYCDEEIFNLNADNASKQTLMQTIEYKDEMKNTVENAGLFILLLSVVIIGIYIINQIQFVKWQKEIFNIPRSDNIFNTVNGIQFICEGIILLIQPGYFLNEKTMNYKVGSNISSSYQLLRLNSILLTVFISIRIYEIVKYLLISSYYYSLRAQRVCKMMKREINLFFAFKAILYKYPFSVIVIGILINTLFGAYLLKIWEGLYNESLASFTNCVWFSIITMTTVGYGNIIIISPVCKIISIIITFTALLLFGIFLFSVNNIFQFFGGELKAYSMINTIELKQQISKYAARMSFLVFKCRILNKEIREGNTDNINNKETVEERKRMINATKKLNECLRERGMGSKAITRLKIEMRKYKETNFNDEIVQNIDNSFHLLENINKGLTKLKGIIDINSESRLNLLNIQSHL